MLAMTTAVATGLALASACGPSTRCTSWTQLDDVAHWFDCDVEGDGPREFRIGCEAQTACLCETLVDNPEFDEPVWEAEENFQAPDPFPLEESEWRTLARRECGWALRP
jgi:hypothetical protein